MNIVVCIKQVPDTQQVRIDPKTGSLIREGVPSIINPEDKNAIEEAVRLKEKHGAAVAVISMGPPQAEEALREAIAMGADRAILLTDRAFAGADTSATSYALGSALKKLAPFDLLLCGRQAIDGDTAQVGPELAEFLDLPQITYVREVEVDGATLRVKRSLEDGYELLETKMPALLTVVKDLNVPRLPSMIDIMNAYEKEIETWHAEDIDADRNKIGLRGSPTRIRRAGPPELAAGNVEFVRGPVEEIVQKLLAILEEKHFV
ncbi:MAG: electron transfer flavoprotein subunit beta/FixA family protein [Chloroflexi bacterium]|nr:electron transfer flavoprotein subunit beta/FixA family protein [Chloroflexota bacterium]